MELHDGNGRLLARNDKWKTDQQVEIEATQIPPVNDAESAIIADLPPGSTPPSSPAKARAAWA